MLTRGKAISPLLLVAVALSIGCLIVAFVALRPNRSHPKAFTENLEEPTGELAVVEVKPTFRQSRPSRGAPAGEITGTASRGEGFPGGGDMHGGMTGSESARLRAAHELAELERSGRSTGEWTTNLHQAFTKWKEAFHPTGSVQLTSLECFERGCAMTSSHEATQAGFASIERIQQSLWFNRWPGLRFRSGPVAVPSGRIETTWIVFHDASTPKLPPDEQEAE